MHTDPIWFPQPLLRQKLARTADREPGKDLSRDGKNEKLCLFGIKAGVSGWAGMAATLTQFYYENEFTENRDLCPFVPCLKPCPAHGRHSVKIHRRKTEYI